VETIFTFVSDIPVVWVACLGWSWLCCWARRGWCCWPGPGRGSPRWGWLVGGMRPVAGGAV